MLKKDFCDSICEKYGGSEVAGIISLNQTCGFYELCQSFLDVALNAKTFKDKDGTFRRLFLQEDIDVVKMAAYDFCVENNIKNQDELFSIIKSEFHDSSSPDDDRRTEAMIKEDDQSVNLGSAENFV